MSQSIVNSHSSNLAADQVWTGDAEDCRGFASVIVSVFADQLSITDGLELQFSSDGTNFDHVKKYSVLASQAKDVSVSCVARYFRVKYTNASTLTAAFRLQTTYHKDVHDVAVTFESSDALEINQATHDDLNCNANMQIADADIGPGNPMPISDNGGSLTVDAIGLDIRALNIFDIVTAKQATHNDLNCNANMQIADADIGAGNPMPISDNGNSITVDANALDTRLLTVSDIVSANMRDGSGNSLSSTTNALHVDVKAAVLPALAATSTLQTAGNVSLASMDGNLVKADTDNVTVISQPALAQATDTIAIYGNDGAANRPIAVDANGHTQCDVLTQPALASGTDSVDAVQSGVWNVQCQDGAGVALNSTAGDLHVEIQNASLPATQSGVWNVQCQDGAGVALNSTAGDLHVEIQNASLPITDNGGSLTVDNAVLDSITVSSGSVNVKPDISKSATEIYNNVSLVADDQTVIDVSAHSSIALIGTCTTGSSEIKVQIEVSTGVYYDSSYSIWPSGGADFYVQIQDIEFPTNIRLESQGSFTGMKMWMLARN